MYSFSNVLEIDPLPSTPKHHILIVVFQHCVEALHRHRKQTGTEWFHGHSLPELTDRLPPSLDDAS